MSSDSRSLLNGGSSRRWGICCWRLCPCLAWSSGPYKSRVHPQLPCPRSNRKVIRDMIVRASKSRPRENKNKKSANQATNVSERQHKFSLSSILLAPLTVFFFLPADTRSFAFLTGMRPLSRCRAHFAFPLSTSCLRLVLTFTDTSLQDWLASSHSQHSAVKPQQHQVGLFPRPCTLSA